MECRVMPTFDDRELGTLLGRQTLQEFCDAQSAQRDHLALELQRFSLNVREAVMKSCEDTLYNFLHKAGFNVKVRRRNWSYFVVDKLRWGNVQQQERTRYEVFRPDKEYIADAHFFRFGFQASTPVEARELLMKTMEEVNPSEISFTERAAMRTQCRKLAKFMKV